MEILFSLHEPNYAAVQEQKNRFICCQASHHWLHYSRELKDALWFQFCRTHNLEKAIMAKKTRLLFFHSRRAKFAWKCDIFSFGLCTDLFIKLLQIFTWTGFSSTGTVAASELPVALAMPGAINPRVPYNTVRAWASLTPTRVNDAHAHVHVH